ncbi:hypothetical protein ACJJTC_018228 [Scirpophaga incertulas]
MHRKWKAFHNPRDYDEFSLLRKRQLRIQKQCFTSFTNRTETLIKNSPKHFWRYVKSKRGGSNYPQNFTLDSESFDDGQQICLAFSNYFQKAFSAPRVSSTNMHHVLSGIDGKYSTCFSYMMSSEVVSTAPELLAGLSLYVPSHGTRKIATFSVPFHATNYGKNCVLTRISQTYNTQFIDVDIFVGSKTTFRRGLNDTLPGNR